MPSIRQHRRRHASHVVALAVGTAALFLPSPRAAAVNIVLSYNSAASVEPTADPSGARLQAIMSYVETYYQDIFEDSHTLTLTYWWDNNSAFSQAGTLAAHTLSTEGGSPWREISGTIQFNNSFSWFFDSTPENDSEFTMGQTLWRDLSAANQANFFNGTAPATFEVGYTGNATAEGGASGLTDLLSVALHETGHALGMSSNNNATVTQTGDSDYDFNPNFVNGNTLAAVTAASNNVAHLAGSRTLMQPAIGTGIRRLPSHTDLFSMASGDSFSDLDVPRREAYASGDWNTNGNWSGNAVPGSGDETHVRNPGSAVLMGLSADGVAGDLFLEEAAWLTTNAHKLDVSDDTTVSGASTRMRVSASGELETADLFVQDTGTVDLIGGTVDVIDDATVDAGAFVEGYGTLQVGSSFNNDGTLRANDSNGNLTLTTAGAGVWNLDGNSGNGVVQASSGNITITGTLSDDFDGTMTVSSSRTITFNSGWALGSGGVLNLNGTSGVASIGGASTINGQVNVTGDGRFTGAVTFNSGAVVSVPSGADLSLNGTTTYNGGSYTGAGTLTQNGNAIIAANTTIAVETLDWDGAGGTTITTINDGVTLTLNSHVIDLGGGTYDGIFNVNGGTLAVNTTNPWSMGGTVNLATATGTATVNGSAITISGAVNATGGNTAVINPNVTFTSAAAVSVSSGTDLILNVTTFNGGSYSGLGEITQSGNFVVGANTTIATSTFDWGNSALLSVNSITINPGVTLSVNSTSLGSAGNEFRGVMQLNSGTLTVNTAGGWTLPASAGTPFFTPGGTLNLNNTGAGTPIVTGQPLTVGGTINTTGVGAISAAVTFNSTAHVNAPLVGDTLSLNGAITYNGGTYSGLGQIAQNGNATVAANTTIDVATYNWDGSGSSTTTVNPGVTFTINSSAIDEAVGDGHDGTITLNGGALAVNTPWALDSTASLILNVGGGFPTVNGSPITVHGTIDANGNASTINAPVDFQSTAVVTLTAASDFLSLTGATTYRGGSYTGAGTLRQSGPATIAANTTIAISGIFDWDGGTFGAGATTINPGVTFTINSPVIDQFGGAYDGAITVNSGTLNVNTTAAWALDPAGSLLLNNTGAGVPSLNGSDFLANGLITATGNGATINANTTFSSTTNLKVPAASDVLILAGATTYAAGSYTGLGTLRQNGAATVSASTTVAVSTFDLDGTAEALASLTVNSGVTFTINSAKIDAGVDGYDGTATLNSGVLTVNTSSAWAMEGTLNMNKPGAPNPTLAGSAEVLQTGTLNVANGGLVSAPYRFGVTPTVNVVASTLLVSNTFASNAGATMTKTGAGTLRVGGTQTHAAGATINVNAGTLLLETNADPTGINTNLRVTVNPTGTATFNAAQRLDSLIINNNSSVTLNAAGNRFVYTHGLSITGTGFLELNDNDAIVDYAGATPFPTVLGYVLSGYNAGNWNGVGIRSNNASLQPNHLTALAIAENSLLGFPSFDGQLVDNTSIIIKYTWYGDANFNGKIDRDDYTLLDRGRAKGLTGWVNGDFNYDNTITAADYLLIDKSFFLQSGVLDPAFLAMREAEFGADYVQSLMASVPEPASLAACGLTLPLLTRRRRQVASLTQTSR